jgi:hypothetical protein
MSDTSATVELTAEPEAAKGGLIKGDDGKLSGRKIVGLGGAIACVAYGGWAIKSGADWKLTLVVMGVCFLLSAFMYGFLTAQNVKGFIASWKGVSG